MNFHTEFTPVTIQPEEIEALSFQMIDEEFGSHSFTKEQYKVVQRIVHTSADFQLGKGILFHEKAIETGIEAIRNGEPIYADVNMIVSGISKKRIEKYGGSVNVFNQDEDVIEEAKRLNTTRAIISVRKATKQFNGGIYLIGNAPTALLELIRLIKEGQAKPSLVIGLPVGFVSALESKQELAKLDVPFITNNERKGGSTITVAAVNALSLLADKA